MGVTIAIAWGCLLGAAGGMMIFLPIWIHMKMKEKMNGTTKD